MTKMIYAYLRASTQEQDANRARSQLEAFAEERGERIAAWFVENESGAKLERPELFKLLENTKPGDILLLEQVDRLSRLNLEDWQRLRSIIDAKGVRVVALDLPTSHMFLTSQDDEFTGRMLHAINGMLLDMLAAIARKDYVDRRRRQAQGVARAKAEGRYPGKQANALKHEHIIKLRAAGYKIDEIVKLTDISRATVFRALRKVKEKTE